MVNENTKITSLFSLSVLLRSKLVMHHFDTLGDLLNYKVEQLLELEGISTYDVACIIELLNLNNYHILNEEILSISYFYNDEKLALLKKCDELLQKRDILRKENNIFLKEEEKLTNLIYALLTKVRELENNEVLKDGYSI